MKIIINDTYLVKYLQFLLFLGIKKVRAHALVNEKKGSE